MWRSYFAQRQGTPVEVAVYEPDAFTARLIHRGVGQVRVVRLQAPAQRVERRGSQPEEGSPDHLVHFLFSLQGRFEVSFGGMISDVRPGEAVMIDNAHPYVLDMKMPHEAIDLIMPMKWLERHLPAAQSLLGKQVNLYEGWGPPLAAMLITISSRDEDYPLPGPMIAEQLGNLLAMAIGIEKPMDSAPGVRLAQQIMRTIESDYPDPELTPDKVAKRLDISKRYLQALLAQSGTSFVRELNAVRLDRASNMLVDPRTLSIPVGEVAYRCGFLDPGYFARQFRKRFDMSPRNWRNLRGDD